MHPVLLSSFKHPAQTLTGWGDGRQPGTSELQLRVGAPLSAHLGVPMMGMEAEGLVF